MGIADCKLIDLPRFRDQRGDLGIIEVNRNIPFAIERVYYLYNVPKGVRRGGHAHKRLTQLFIAIAGSFDVLLDDGTQRARFRLDRPDCGLYICPMIWRELDNFSTDGVCLVLASNLYDETDYFRTYEEFVSAHMKALT